MENIYKNRLLLLVDALRSGSYKEKSTNKITLRDEDKFSVNGIACEVYRLFTGCGRWKGNSFTEKTEELMSYITCGCSNFYFGTGDYSSIRLGTVCLQKMFAEGTSFKEIANIIERHLNE